MTIFRPVALILASAVLASCSGGDKTAQDNTAAAPAADTSVPAADVTAPAADTTATADSATASNAAVPATNTATIDGTTLASFTGDAAAGEKAFVTCKTCHSVVAGQNRIGPSLHGVVGREAGTVAGFNYTAANKNSGITWTDDKLFQYLEKPQRVVPGTKMAYPGQGDPQIRANLIAYLKTQG